MTAIAKCNLGKFYRCFLGFLFVSCFIFTTGFFLLTVMGPVFGFQKVELVLDTQLGDLSPGLSQNTLETRQEAIRVQTAIDQVTASIHQRFVIVVTGSDAGEVERAAQLVSHTLNVRPEVAVVLQEELQAQIVETLEPYRFTLLTDRRRTYLQSASIEEVADDGYRALYDLEAGARLLDFSQDPFGWLSEYVFHVSSTVYPKAVQPKLDAQLGGQQQFVKSISAQLAEESLSLPQQQEVITAIDALESQLNHYFDVDLYRSGTFFFGFEAAQSAKSDIQRISQFSTLGIVLLLLFVFRSVLPLLLASISILVGVAFAFAVAHLVFGSIHILTIVFGASLIGIVVDYTIHYFCHYQPSSGSNEGSLSRSLHRALFLSLLTSLVGYSALGLSSLEALQKVAVFSISGLFVAWLSVVCLGGLISKYLSVVSLRKPSGILNGFIGNFKDSRQGLSLKKVLALIFCLSIGSIFLVSMYGVAPSERPKFFSDDPRLFFDLSADLISQEESISTLMKRYEPGRYVVITGRSVEAVFERLEGFYAGSQKEGVNTDQILSLKDFLPGPKAQKLNYNVQESVYKQGGAVFTLYRYPGLEIEGASYVSDAYQNSENHILYPRDFFEAIKSLPSLWIEQEEWFSSLVLLSTDVDAQTIQRVAQAQENVWYIDTLEQTSSALTQQRKSALQLLWLAYVGIALLLSFYYKSFIAGMLVLLPIASTFLTLMVLIVFGQAITLFHVMALFLVLGLGMDYGIFVYEMSANIRVTLRAVLLSAVTSVLSFGLLGLSDIPVAKAFGVTVFIGNIFNVVLVLLYAPAISKEREGGEGYYG